MSVDAKTYVEVMRRYPVKFKFQGIDGFHQTITDAVQSDSSRTERYQEKEAEYHEKQLENIIDGKPSDYDEDDLETYGDWLRGEVKLSDIEDYRSFADAQVLEQIKMMEQSSPCCITERRCEFISTFKSLEWEEAKELATEGLEEHELLKEHLIEEVYSTAYEEGVPVDDVWFLCPGMGCYEPQTKQSVGERYYCGKCGCEWLEGDLHDDAEFRNFCDSLGLDPWPFRVKQNKV